MRGPSQKALGEWLDRVAAKTVGWKTPTVIPRGAARQLKMAMNRAESHDEVDKVLDLANKLADLHGVEALRGDYQVDRYYYDIVALYVNTGETYDRTLLYETDTGRFVLASWGDWVERYGHRYQIQ